MPLIPFPNVPNVPGVPAIPRSPSFPPAVSIILGTLQSALIRSFTAQQKWGIYDAFGVPLGDPGSFVDVPGGILATAGIGYTLSTGSIDYAKETKISDYPIEKGSFASYNKVEMPAAPVVALCFTGNEVDRRAFLASIDIAVKSTDFYSIATPEVTYLNYSIERYNYQRRSEKGLTLLIVEIYLKEIRQVSSLYTISNPGGINKPKDVGAVPTVDGGKVQAKTPDVSTIKSLANKFLGLFK